MADFQIREIKAEEYHDLGALMVEVSTPHLTVSPPRPGQPGCYQMLKKIGLFAPKKPLPKCWLQRKLIKNIWWQRPFRNRRQYGSVDGAPPVQPTPPLSGCRRCPQIAARPASAGLSPRHVLPWQNNLGTHRSFCIRPSQCTRPGGCS